MLKLECSSWSELRDRYGNLAGQVVSSYTQLYNSVLDSGPKPSRSLHLPPHQMHLRLWFPKPDFMNPACPICDLTSFKGSCVFRLERPCQRHALLTET